MTGRTIRRPAAKLGGSARPAGRLAGGVVACGLLLAGPSTVAAARRPARGLTRVAVQGISLLAQASPNSLGLGSSFVDVATLTPTGGGPPPTGTISFSVYGPTDPGCAGPVLFNSTNTVTSQASLSGAYATPSAGLTPPNVGTYRVIVTYNGDASYKALATACGDPANTVVVGLAPTLTAISPSSGPPSGGNPVTITGTNLTGAVTVNFGGVAAPASVVSSTQVFAHAPAGSGSVNVTVSTESATTPVVAAGLYTYDGSPGSPGGSAGPIPGSSVQPLAPAVVTGRATKVTSSTASFTGRVGPSGVTSVAYFEYIVRLPGARAITRRTPGQAVGPLGRRVTARVSGLRAKRHYRVRLIVIDAAGTTTSPATGFATHSAKAR